MFIYRVSAFLYPVYLLCTIDCREDEVKKKCLFSK
jgi:hypothetical protein